MFAEVLNFTIDDDFVGHAAGLRALAAVRAALAERLAGETLAGVGDAECAVHEDFQGSFRDGGLEALDFSNGKLAGEDGAGFEMDYHGQVRGHLEVTF